MDFGQQTDGRLENILLLLPAVGGGTLDNTELI